VEEIDQQHLRQAYQELPSASNIPREGDADVSALSAQELAMRIDEIQRRMLGDADTKGLISEAALENARNVIKKAALH
jgi:hypothetical protein